MRDSKTIRKEMKALRCAHTNQSCPVCAGNCGDAGMVKSSAGFLCQMCASWQAKQPKQLKGPGGAGMTPYQKQKLAELRTLFSQIQPAISAKYPGRIPAKISYRKVNLEGQLLPAGDVYVHAYFQPEGPPLDVIPDSFWDDLNVWVDANHDGVEVIDNELIIYPRLGYPIHYADPI